MDGAFTITMSNPSDQNTVVKFSIAGTATSGTDFTSIPLSATIPANATQVVIPVDVLNDNIVEGTETVVIKLQSPTTSPYAAKIFLGAIGSTYVSDGIATVSFQDGINSYTGTSDTFLDQFNPAFNHGLDMVLSVSVDTGLLNEQDGLLKFDGIVGTTNGLIPLGTKLVNATVELFTSAGNVVVYQLLLPFNELVDTWSNSFGANGVQPNGFEATNSGTAALLPGGPSMFSISSPLLLSTIQGWINGGTNNGLALLSPNFVQFASSEFGTIANRPRLTATLDVSASLDIIDTDTATVSVIGSNPASEPSTNGSLVIGLSSKASSNVVVFYNDVLSGTAISGSDYVAIPAGSVTILAGNTTATIVVVPNNDSLVEAPETVNLVISKITVTDPEITLGSPSTGTVIINDNDFALVSITGTTNGDENTVGNTILAPINGSFTISMSTPSSVDTVVSLSIGGTATSGSDYTAIPLSVTIPANFLSTTIPVAVIDDLINEAPIETVTLNLTGITGGLLTQTFLGAPSSASVNIADDEQPLTVNNVATKATATEGGPNGEFQFQLNFPSDNATTITYKILASSTATPFINGTQPDFNASALTGSVGPSFTTGTVVIPIGATTVALPVNAYQDYIAEGPETVNLQITSITNNNPSTIGTATTTVTIQDVVYTVSVLKTDSPAAEPGPPAGSNGQFTFSLTAPLPEPTVVTYSIGGTATPSTPIPVLPLTPDYVGLSGTVTIPANTTQFKLSVLVIDDLIVEPDETVIVTITGASSAGPTYAFPNGVPTVGFNATPATETINDNDSATISITGVDGTELGQPAGIVGNFPDGKFVISQTLVSSSNTVVTYAVQAASTATNGTDYTAITGTLTATILAGNTSVSIPVDVLQDLTLEPTETVVMKILTTTGTTDPQILIGGTNQATVNIVDDDTATVSIVPIGPFGFEPGANDGQYAVILSNPSSVPTVVSYSLIAPGPTDATPGSDFSLRDGALNPIGLLTGSVTIPAGQTSTPIIVDVLDDNIIENDEAVRVMLTGTDNAAKITVNAIPATVTILDFGSADQDTGKVTIAKLVDGDESPVGVGKTDGKFILTLVPTNPFFNVANGPFSSDENTVVTYSISGASTALNPSDHTLALTGSVTILAGQTTAILTVPVVDDNVAELPESLTISLTGTLAPTHAAIVVDPTSATIAMLDDDVSVLTISSPTLVEGAAGTTAMVFTVTSPNAVQGGFSVVFSVGGGNATFAVDYTVVTVSPLTFVGNAGETQTITVNINGDNVVELSETFNVTLGTATPGLPLVQTGAVGVGTITNDDTAIITISSPTVLEGTNGTPGTGPFTNMVYSVTSSNPIDIAYTIDVLLGNGTAIGGDFDPFLLALIPVPVNVLTGLDFDNDAGNSNSNISRVTFAAAANTLGVQALPAAQSIIVRVVQDNFVEGGTANNPGSETIAASLGDITASRSTVVTATGVGTITDDDVATVSLFANDNKASEPLDTVNEGNGQFTVTQTALSSSDTVITYSVGGTATPSGTSALVDDYTKLTGTVTILAGQSTATIDVTVLDNALVENDETVIVTLTGFVSRDPNVSLSGTLTDTVTIFDDDQALVTIVANDNAASEDPLDNGQFTLTMNAISDTATVVTYSIATGGVNATNGSDYSTLSGTATIAAGKTTTTIDVVVLQDALVEGAETVTLTLTGFLSPTNADIKIGAPSNDTVTIADDTDGIIVSVFNNGSGTEGGNNGSFIVKITKSDGITPVAAPATGLTVNYSSAGGTAVGGPSGDYVALSGSIFIPPGATTGLIDVSVIDDLLVEATETVNVTLVTLSLATFPVLVTPFTEPVTIGTANATVNIIDNDKAVFTVEDLVVNEGDGTGTLTVKISNKLEGISVPVTVNYTPITAGSPSDFSPSGSQTLTFLPGSLASQTVTFTIVDDGLVEGLEGFGVSLSTTYVNGPGLHVVDTTDTAVVAILDNDSTIFAIQDVKVGSTFWSPTFNDFVDNTGAPIGERGYSIPAAAQATPLPWSNINQLFVKFSQDPDVATLTTSNFLLFGLQGASTPSITAVAYDTVNNVATLTLSGTPSGTITNDRLRLQVKDAVTYLATPLDGDWTNNADTFDSGNGVPGGIFNFTFNVLPGDVNQNGTVATNDAGIVFSKVGSSTDGTIPVPALNGNPYSIFADVNGSGNINTGDAGLVFSRISIATSTLPIGSPGSLSRGSNSNSDETSILDSLRRSFGDWKPNPIANPVLRRAEAAPSIMEDVLAGDEGYIDSLVNSGKDSVETDLVDSVFTDLFRRS